YNLMHPNSCCPHCNHAIRPWQNIPLLSYLLLRGRCAECQGSISLRYPLTELACGLMSAWVAWHFGFGWQAGAVLLLSWGLLAMSLIDADHQLLPDVLVLPLMWLGLVVNSSSLLTTLPDAVWGAVIGYM
ncbi:prepilin peptidase, partial [Pseudomonas viridiflava]|uniref:prepilin peptidase n=1 Tax=Pseudomonas viridiflava TaxID=33069 RepID=UPI0013DED9E7